MVKRNNYFKNIVKHSGFIWGIVGIIMVSIFLILYYTLGSIVFSARILTKLGIFILVTFVIYLLRKKIKIFKYVWWIMLLLALVFIIYIWILLAGFADNASLF